MRDFTLRMYRRLLASLQEAGYEFVTFEAWQQNCIETKGRKVILRHDVDKKPQNSLKTAHIEHELGIRASYYFRCVACSNDPEVIREIAALGHEIGYHYEDMSLCDGDVERAKAHFTEWLTYFRQFYKVKTICMHGAPTSRYDGRDLWKHYDYHDWGIIGEPYFDIDFSDWFYLTDTGRCWDGYKVSVRDKIEGHQDRWIAQGMVFHSTEDIIRRLQGEVPPQAHKLSLQNKIMITTHPQRWTDNKIAWVKELVGQTVKNIIKRCYVR